MQHWIDLWMVGLLLTLSGCGHGGHPTSSTKSAVTCQQLLGLKFEGAQLESAEDKHFPGFQEIGAFSIPPLPVTSGYCRVDATLSTAPGSVVHAEVWLPPADGWNGKLVDVGNAGYGGSIGPARLTMRTAISKGYATAGDDLGHVGDGTTGEASWALKKPVQIADFGYAANHATAVFAKALVARYYGTEARHAYFEGCSDGGREALMEAQRYPEDFGGIVAGAPANSWTRLMTSFAWNARAVSKTAHSLIPKEKLALVQAAALRQCDSIDGVADGVIEDPRACKFDPTPLMCKSGDGAQCLTSAQLDALKAIYQGPRDPVTGSQLMPGFPSGAEALDGGWDVWISRDNPQHATFSTNFYRNFVFNDLAWDLQSMDFHRDPEKGNEAMSASLNSDNPDLSAFEGRGGRLIMYHGWADAAITPYNTIAYFDSVKDTLGAAKTEQFARLYMVPGMAHCLGGPGANNFDMLAELDNWVDHGTPPQSVIASKFKNDMQAFIGLPAGDPIKTRRLCPYPSVATWDGKSSANSASSFQCKVPEESL